MSKEKDKVREKIKHDLDSLTILEDEESNEESDKDKVLKVLLEKKDINLKTELNDKEILEIAKLEVLSSRLNSNSLELFLQRFKELRVSKNRQGRKEIIGAIQEDETKARGGFFDQFVTDLMGKRT